MREPKDIMEKYKFFPSEEDIAAAYTAAVQYADRVNDSEVPEVGVFHAAFYRGCFWMQEKHKEMLDLAIKFFGTDDPKLAKERVKKVRKLINRRRRG